MQSGGLCSVSEAFFRTPWSLTTAEAVHRVLDRADLSLVRASALFLAPQRPPALAVLRSLPASNSPLLRASTVV